MATTKRLTVENVNLDNAREVDALFEEIVNLRMPLVHADIARLQAAGLMDEEGNLLATELPPDMRPGSKHDFGG
jgi:hypothetical protein